MTSAPVAMGTACGRRRTHMLKVCFLYLHVSTLKSKVGMVLTASALRFSPRLSL